MNKRELSYLKYGIPHNLTKRLVAENLTLSSIRNTKSSLIRDKFNFNEAEIKFIKEKITRRPISSEIVNRLLLNNNFTCCCCIGQKGQSFIIHHIDEYGSTQNNNYDNLALLCPFCHDLAHAKRSLTLNISKKQLKMAKFSWEKTSQEKRAGQSNPKPIFETWQTTTEFEASHLFDLSIVRDRELIKGSFSLINLHRGNTFFQGEFTHSAIGLSFDITFSFWEVQWGIRSSKVKTAEAVLNYLTDDTLSWRNLDDSLDALPLMLDLKRINTN